MPQRLLSRDPNWGAGPSIGAAMPGTAMPDIRGENEADLSNVVTFDDLANNPGESMQKIGQQLKKEASDPRNWVSLAAMYFGPKVAGQVAPLVSRAALAARTGAAPIPASEPGVISRVASVLEPADIGILSPRIGRAVDLAQRVRGAVKPVPTAETVAPAPPAVAPEPVAPPSASVAPAARAGQQGGVSPTAAAKPTLTLEEFHAAQKLVKEGYPVEDVLKAIQRNRIPKSWLNLPSDADVATSVANRNATGRWPE